MFFNPTYTITIEIARSLVFIEEEKEQIDFDKPVFEYSNIKNATNYSKALDYIKHLNEVEFTESIIKIIHGLVVNGNKDSTVYRDKQNVIRDATTGKINYIPTDTKDIKPLMNSLVEWVNTEIEKGNTPIPIIAAIAHYQIATIHPFLKGNGKTARLVELLLLKNYGYGLKGFFSLEEFYKDNKRKYYETLAVDNTLNYYIGRVEADITKFLAFSINAMHTVLSKNNNIENTSITKENLRELNPQQKKILKLFTEYQEISIQDIAKKLKIKKRGASHLVKKWLDKGFLTVGNPSNKMRTYKLSLNWEKYIYKKVLESTN